MARTLPTWQGRLVAGVALIGAIVVGLWPDHPRDIDAEKLVAVVLTGAAWLFAELANSGGVSEHDRKLFASIESQFSDGVLAHLREHDFAVDVHKTKASALWDLGYMEGSRYRFLDRPLQAKWSELFAALREFNNLQAEYLSPSSTNGDALTIHLHGEPRYPVPASVQAEIKKLNEAAPALERLFNEFAALARRRLGL
ncbi:hypothetical protein [uncultured Sphingomonas sp.]|uniref:hypothetical protein n=1 Tax=uncultured Sphingomonas sp. TaxID=158754 RepID=UPI0035CC0340